jgi:hypothetical protein
VTTCASCKAPIVFAVTSKTGRRIPLDTTTSRDGNIAIVGRTAQGTPIAHVFRQADLDLARVYGAVDLYLSHFASCPNADRWRKPPQPKGAA